MAVNLLLSYAFHEGTDLAAIRRNLVCGLLMADSGAFTAHTKGRAITLDGYAAFLEKWRGCWDYAVTLDAIGDGRATAANTRKLHARGLPVMPVFTRGDTLTDFDAMVRDVGYVCVGGLVGLPAQAQVARVGMLQRRALDAGGGIHALGIGSIPALRAARPYSSDASSVSSAFKFGVLVYFDGQRIRTVAATDRVRLARDREHLLAHGINLARIVSTGRLPNQGNGRQDLMQAMSLAYAAADEVLKRSPVPAPERLHDGPHLYSSLGRAADAEWSAQVDRRLHPGPHLFVSPAQPDAEGAAAADSQLHGQRPDGPHLYSSVVSSGWKPERLASEADKRIHSGWCPRVWATYGVGHVCRRKEAARAS